MYNESFIYSITLGSILSRPETDPRRKKKRIEEKKVFSCCESFYDHAYSTDLVRHIRRTSERTNSENEITVKEKNHVDWTNWHILEQMNREENKTKLSVSSLRIKSLWYHT